MAGADNRDARENRDARDTTHRPAAPAAAARSRAHLTSRAAILAVVVCAIALSLAYPIREYIAQRREIAALREQQRTAQRQVEQLAQHKKRLGDEAYIKREARRRLHYCMPGEKCYVVLDGGGAGGQAVRQGRAPRTPPWYVTLWRSVDAADKGR
jgi:cell division protein FtsB